MSTENCILTTKDFTILEVLRDRCGSADDPLAPILKHKIETAQVVFREDIPVNVATMSSRVTFSINGRDLDTRVISHYRMATPVGLFLPVTTVRGLALLGLAEGQEFILTNSEGVKERLLLEKVQYQPEAVRREKKSLADASLPMQRKLVRRASYEQPQLAAAEAEGFDDPGPSTA